MTSVQLWNLDDGVPLTPRVASAASFEHLITDNFRADAPRFLPEPWGYATEESDRYWSDEIPELAMNLLSDQDILESMIDWDE